MGNAAKKIMVCDDDRDILDVTCMLLEMAGFDVTTQYDSARLINQAKAGPPDLFLIDIWMPQLSGDQLTRQIKSNVELSHIPVILFSAAIDGKMIAKESGAEYFIEKPFDMENLSGLVRAAFD